MYTFYDLDLQGTLQCNVLVTVFRIYYEAKAVSETLN